MQPHNNYSADCFAQSVFFFATPFTIFVAFYLSPTHPLLRSGVKKRVIVFPPRYRSCLAFLSRKYFSSNYFSSSFVDAHRIIPTQTTSSQQLLIFFCFVGRDKLKMSERRDSNTSTKNSNGSNRGSTLDHRGDRRCMLLIPTRT